MKKVLSVCFWLVSFGNLIYKLKLCKWLTKMSGGSPEKVERVNYWAGKETFEKPEPNAMTQMTEELLIQQDNLVAGKEVELDSQKYQ